MKLTIKKFCEYSNIDSKLIKAVVRQSGGWEAFQEKARDIYNHGIMGGYGGWIYYSETVNFYTKNRALIVSLAEKQAQEDGDTVSMVKGFCCLNDDYNHSEVAKTLYGRKKDIDTQIANALAWYACEEVARSFCDMMEG